MSALLPKADIAEPSQHARYVPKADIAPHLHRGRIVKTPECARSSCFWNPTAKGGADNAGERNHRQYGAEASEGEGNSAASNTDAAAKKGAGIDNP